MNAKAVLNAKLREVRAQHTERRRRLLHKNHAGCSTADSLETHGAGASKKIKKHSAVNARRQHIEERFAQAVAGGTRF